MNLRVPCPCHAMGGSCVISDTITTMDDATRPGTHDDGTHVFYSPFCSSPFSHITVSDPGNGTYSTLCSTYSTNQCAVPFIAQCTTPEYSSSVELE